MGALMVDRPRDNLSGFTCPECGGAVWERADGPSVEFECRVGHLYPAGAMLVEHETAREAALWTALRLTAEHAALRRRLADLSRQRGLSRAATRFEAEAAEADQDVERLRRMIEADGRR
jgi:two-component system chemotaxis response regulator CheB